MNILLFGRGVIGTLYAWAFEKAGHTVAFYVREGRKAQYGSYVNLDVWDARRSKKDRRVKEKWPIVTHEDIKENHSYDLIILSVNPEQVADAVKYLAPRVGKATVLFFNNYWQDPKAAVQPIPLEQMVYGFPGAGGGFEGNTLHGGLYHTVQLGTFKTEPTARNLAVHQLFADAGFKVGIHKDMQSWLWNHFAFNVAMEIEVLKSGSFRNVVSSPEALAGMGRDLKEMIPVLKAKGAKLDGLTKMVGILPPGVFGFIMRKFVFAPDGMIYALVAHNYTKVGYAVQDIIAEARKLGIDAPRLFAVEKLTPESGRA